MCESESHSYSGELSVDVTVNEREFIDSIQYKVLYVYMWLSLAEYLACE